MSDERCDWCLRPKAPPGDKYRYLPEQKDLCFGYPDPSCIWHHGEAWDRLHAEVARLREEVAEGERKLGTAKALLPVYDGRPVSQGALNALLSQRDTAWEKNDRLHEQLEEANETIRQAVGGYSADLRKADLRAEEAEAQLSEERTTSARLRGLLREVEWIDASWLAGECPICVRQRVLGHAPDCRLAAALKEKP